MIQKYDLSTTYGNVPTIGNPMLCHEDFFVLIANFPTETF